ncbi:10042_t:CDS:2, partial [Entrophospora sp. SA101]
MLSTQWSKWLKILVFAILWLTVKETGAQEMVIRPQPCVIPNPDEDGDEFVESKLRYSIKLFRVNSSSLIIATHCLSTEAFK